MRIIRGAMRHVLQPRFERFCLGTAVLHPTRDSLGQWRPLSPQAVGVPWFSGTDAVASETGLSRPLGTLVAAKATSAKQISTPRARNGLFRIIRRSVVQVGPTSERGPLCRCSTAGMVPHGGTESTPACGSGSVRGR